METKTPTEFICNGCGTKYNPSDYNPDARQWLCSICKRPLPKEMDESLRHQTPQMNECVSRGSDLNIGRMRLIVLKTLAALSVFVVGLLGVFALFNLLGEITLSPAGQKVTQSFAATAAPEPTEKESLPQPPPEESLSHNKDWVWIKCKRLVGEQLPSPRSAKWPYDPISVVRNEDDSYTIRAYVDSKNQFGVILRTRFTAKIKSFDGVSWSLLSLVEE